MGMAHVSHVPGLKNKMNFGRENFYDSSPRISCTGLNFSADNLV